MHTRPAPSFETSTALDPDPQSDEAGGVVRYVLSFAHDAPVREIEHSIFFDGLRKALYSSADAAGTTPPRPAPIPTAAAADHLQDARMSATYTAHAGPGRPRQPLEQVSGKVAPASTPSDPGAMVSTRAHRRGIALSRSSWTGVSPGPAPDLRTDEQIRAGLRAQWDAVQAGRRRTALGIPPGFLAIVLWEAGPAVQAEAVRVARKLPEDACRRYWDEPTGEGSIDVAFLQVAAWAQHGRSAERLSASHLPYGASRSRLHRHFAPRLSREALLVVAEVADGRGRHGPVLADVCRRVTGSGPYAPEAETGA